MPGEIFDELLRRRLELLRLPAKVLQLSQSIVFVHISDAVYTGLGNIQQHNNVSINSSVGYRTEGER